MPSLTEKIAFSYRHCETLVRQEDPDRYFASLFADADKRPHLMALYAFNVEIALIPEATREPITGEIRLQWWRDALVGGVETGAGGSEAHPVATAINETINRFRLPREAFVNLIDARAFDLYRDLRHSLNDLEGYCGETCSALFQLAAMILADGAVDSADISGHGGVAYAMTGLMRAFPWHIRRGRLFVPVEILNRFNVDSHQVIDGKEQELLRNVFFSIRDTAINHLDEAERVLGEIPLSVSVAFLPLYLIRPYLKLMDQEGIFLQIQFSICPNGANSGFYGGHRAC